MKLSITLLTLVGINTLSFSEEWPEWGGDGHNNMFSSAKGIPVEMEPGKRKKGTEDIDMSTTKNVKWVAKSDRKVTVHPRSLGAKC